MNVTIHPTAGGICVASARHARFARKLAPRLMMVGFTCQDLIRRRGSLAWRGQGAAHSAKCSDSKERNNAAVEDVHACQFASIDCNGTPARSTTVSATPAGS